MPIHKYCLGKIEMIRECLYQIRNFVFFLLKHDILYIPMKHVTYFSIPFRKKMLDILVYRFCSMCGIIQKKLRPII